MIVRKSLIIRFLIWAFSYILLILLLAAVLYKTDYVIDLKFYILSIFGFLIVFVLNYYFDVVSPLSKIVVQMQALLTGKEYKNVYTNRFDEIAVISYFYNQVIKSFGKVTFDIKDRERMIDELKIAAQLQRDILPLENPSVPGLSIVAKNKPASEVGGDSFNILTENDRTFIYIGDVTGHGVAAGLIMTMVNSLVTVFASQGLNAFDIMVNVNRHIKRHVKKAMFMTMVMFSWDHKTQKLTYVGAGHEHFLIYRAETGQLETFLSGGVALGMVADNSSLIHEKELVLNDGDFVVLYTDGITEARNINEELYGLDRLCSATLNYAAEYSAEGLNYNIAKDVSAFMQGHEQMDDMTLIVMQKTKGEKKLSAAKTSWDK